MKLHLISQPTTRLEQVPLGLHDHAFRGRHGVPNDVVAVRIVHILFPEPFHGLVLVRGEGGEAACHEGGVAVRAVRRRYLLNGVDDATLKHHVAELGGEGFVGVVHLVPAAVGGPCRGVPYGCVHRHWL
ncbi:hypothetical protein DM860_013446 [Cuscuta australis]|uniref:Uncharacterized protein n=1 Tax=Cuscuta australis TaxID=267555 RepID=A0A328CZ75_9ASTE|nr:hypothetical protein DM860_013446 [Cuscuta australis]